MKDLEAEENWILPPLLELGTCVAVLRSLQPSDLQRPELKDLLDVGAKLFKSHILKEKFGSSDVAGVLKEKFQMKEEGKKLKKIQKAIQEEHSLRLRKSEDCGMNKGRRWREAVLAKAKADSVAPLFNLCDIEHCEAVGALENIGLNDEAAIDSKESAETDTTRATSSSSPPPRGDFRKMCNVCRDDYFEQHHFYHQLCPSCADSNWEKRGQTADMTGMVCVVTGGRVRIGYKIVLKLLRAGAFVLTTSRFPQDCALRYSLEADFDKWRHRLEVCGPFELSDMRLVERFCDQLLRRFPRIHVLINNAAQTLTRREGWQLRMASLENAAAAALPQNAQRLLRSPTELASAMLEDETCPTAPTCSGTVVIEPNSDSNMTSLVAVKVEPDRNLADDAAEDSQELMWREAAQLEDFPEGKLDESLQPLDLSSVNSWSRRLGEIPTLELLQTLAANAAAPFIMCSRLTPILAASSEEGPFGHIINVSALEGKFSVRRKSSVHPHTNMAKAALNMLTHTSAEDLFRRRILMNCVDTGWITDNAPGGLGVVASTHVVRSTPPLDEEDGAARVLDPIFLHLNDPTWLIRGKFFKNYLIAGW